MTEHSQAILTASWTLLGGVILLVVKHVIELTHGKLKIKKRLRVSCKDFREIVDAISSSELTNNVDGLFRDSVLGSDIPSMRKFLKSLFDEEGNCSADGSEKFYAELNAEINRYKPFLISSDLLNDLNQYKSNLINGTLYPTDSELSILGLDDLELALKFKRENVRLITSVIDFCRYLRFVEENNYQDAAMYKTHLINVIVFGVMTVRLNTLLLDRL